MSSLLQFKGKISREGVHIEVYKTIPGRKEIEFTGDGKVIDGASWEETFTCRKCKRIHPILYSFPRKPVGMMGQWVVFRYNGEEHVPDLSCPFGIDKIPKGAKKHSQEESEELWHQY